VPKRAGSRAHFDVTFPDSTADWRLTFFHFGVVGYFLLPLSACKLQFREQRKTQLRMHEAFFWDLACTTRMQVHFDYQSIISQIKCDTAACWLLAGCMPAACRLLAGCLLAAWAAAAFRCILPAVIFCTSGYRSWTRLCRSMYFDKRTVFWMVAVEAFFK